MYSFRKVGDGLSPGPTYSFQNDPFIILREQNIFQKCELLTAHLNAHSAKDLQAYYSHIIDNLFETNLCAIGDRNTPGEFVALVNLLSPKGPVFQLVDKLTAQMTSPRILLALTRLPTGLVEQLVSTNASHFLLHKMSLDGHYLQVNPLEYFLFQFLGHLIEPRMAEIKMDINNWPVVVYFTLFDRYLAHLLDVGDQGGCQTTILQTLGSRFHPCGRPVGRGHHCLLKKDTLLNGSHLSMNSNSSLLLSTSNRSTTFMNILSELWFASPPPGENQQLQRAMCILVKKLHSCGHFESSTGGLLRRRMYKFMRIALTAWPLDFSFRLPLEVWLAFIQPWRYANGENPSGIYGEVLNPDRYRIFIDQHLLFYTQFLLMTLERISVLDLSLPPNVVLISRICKVFSQERLMATILSRESRPDVLQHSISEFDHPNFQHVRSDQWRAKARELIRSLRHSQIKVEARIEALKRTLREKAWWAKLWDSMQGIAEPNLNADERTLDKLQMSINKLSYIFQVEISDIDISVADDLRDASFESTLSVGPQRYLFDLRYLGVPEKQPPRPNEIEWLIPVLHEWSIRLNVRFGERLKRLYQRRNIDWVAYLLIALIQAFILPPSSYVEIRKERDFLSPRRHVEIDYPARFYLRPLARKSVYYLAAGLPVLFYCFATVFGLKLILTVLLIVVLCLLTIEKLCVAFYPNRDDDSFQ
ncbi:sphingomyelin phosphodiesterase 4-like [Tropilaelaps mercedesae]|uniref:Sphingomyelin phosphodiesterase 4-like n=1 Tax=Tropilaelaps mercedesae TaxID=418985 RepID=A0A1V9X8Q2_9ACAR|nr:sphingomyelin phosphodiesterase 4-like [Tropilaelaps mercedesae]